MAILFAIFITGLVFLLHDKQYLLAALLAGIIYFTFFLIGKRISLLFLQLSLLKLLKGREGKLSHEECSQFLRNQYKKNISATDFEKLLSDIYESLTQKGLVSRSEEGIHLINP